MTAYLALLRGINVGGKNKVDMGRLRTAFEDAGSTRVSTYINSGNVLFDDRRTAKRLTARLEGVIADEFGLEISVVLREAAELATTANAIPRTWKDDSATRCYVMFLRRDIDTPDLVEQLVVKPRIDKVRYVAGALVWRADRAHLTQSGMMRLMSSELYKSMTVRSSNTVRKLDQLMTRRARSGPE